MSEELQEMSELESLQNAFKRPELKQQQDEGKGLCGHAAKIDAFLKLLRMCDLDHITCEHYGNRDLVRTCPTLRKLNAEKMSSTF